MLRRSRCELTPRTLGSEPTPPSPTPDLDSVLRLSAERRLLVESIYCTLAEAMQVFAENGRLTYISCGEYDWFSEQTVASLHMQSCSAAVLPEWRSRALDMLRITSPHLVAMTGNRWGTRAARLSNGDSQLPFTSNLG